MADVSFPANFEMSMPVPMPPWTHTPFVNIQFNLVAKIRQNFGPAFTFQIFQEMTLSVSTVESGTVTVDTTDFDYTLTYSAGLLTCEITASQDLWIIDPIIDDENMINLIIYGNNSSPWNLQTFNSILYNSNSGGFLEFNNTDGPLWMNPRWALDLGGLRYNSYTNPGFLTYTEVEPPNPGDPAFVENMIFGGLYRLPCFTPCVPHAIKVN